MPVSKAPDAPSVSKDVLADVKVGDEVMCTVTSMPVTGKKTRHIFMTVDRVTPKRVCCRGVEFDRATGVPVINKEIVCGRRVVPATKEALDQRHVEREANRKKSTEQEETRKKHAKRDDVQLLSSITHHFANSDESKLLQLGIEKLRKIAAIAGIG